MNEQTKCGLLFGPLAASPVLIDWMKYFWSLVSGIIMSFLGYLIPIRDIMHLLIVFFILDVIFGYWAAKRLRNERFSTKLIWKTTMPRMVISMVLIIGAYMWDTVYNQDLVATYKIIGWFISGVLLASIVQNGYHITRWKMLVYVGDFVKKKIADQTGVDISEKNNTDET